MLVKLLLLVINLVIELLIVISLVKEYLKKFIWENKEISDATLRTVIKRVKDKIVSNDFIVSKKGLGYIIE